MQPNRLYESRQKSWKRLSNLVDRSQSSVQRLTPAEIKELGQLYRSASSDLALAQRDFPDHKVTIYLNQLVGRAHAVVYRGRPLARNRFKVFITTDFPQTFRDLWPFVLTAAALFIIPAIFSMVVILWQPEAASWILPAEVQNLIPIIEDKELWTDIPVNERPFASSFIMQNNIQVAFLSFAGGVLAGIPTVWIMLFNGLILGGITGLTAYHDVGFELWTFVIGHGVIELSVIFMAGGAGLSMGWALLRPGLLRRRDALMLASRKAILLILGCIPLLFMAGLIEGFISPAEGLPWPVKWVVGLVSGILLYSYLIFAGRDKSQGSEQRFALQLQIAVDDGN